MNFNQELGLKIKKLRLNEKLTLVECSELTGLSVGFLSQIENGKTSISIDNLQIIAKCLDVELNYFFVQDEEKQNVMITRKWSQNSSKKSDKIASTLLSDFENAKSIISSLLTFAPGTKADRCEETHDGDVFFYVIEGILILQTENGVAHLYPGDSAHFNAKRGFSYWNESPFITRTFLRKNGVKYRGLDEREERL